MKLSLQLFLSWCLIWLGQEYHVQGFVPSSSSPSVVLMNKNTHHPILAHMSMRSENDQTIMGDAPTAKTCTVAFSSMERRGLFQSTAAVLAIGLGLFPSMVVAEEENIFAPKFVQEYPDFVQSDEGWSYKDVKVGSGESPKAGDRVVYEWSGYTIGYFGRPFEAKGGPKGGAFDKEIDNSRVVLGSGSIVKGLDCAFRSMKPGGIRQVLVPYGELGYPADDGNHDRVGPKPTTFSGMRALNFVLDNPRVDRTMLFNVKLVRVDKPDGKGGFVRGDK